MCHIRPAGSALGCKASCFLRERLYIREVVRLKKRYNAVDETFYDTIKIK